MLGEWGAPDAIGTALECLIVMAAEARALLDADEEVEVDVEFRANAVPGDTLAEIRARTGMAAALPAPREKRIRNRPATGRQPDSEPDACRPDDGLPKDARRVGSVRGREEQKWRSSSTASQRREGKDPEALGIAAYDYCRAARANRVQSCRSPCVR